MARPTGASWLKLYRKLRQSRVWQRSPLCRCLWLEILLCADWKTGSFETTVRALCEALAWTERNVVKTPNPKTVHEILKWMAEGQDPMIVLQTLSVTSDGNKGPGAESNKPSAPRRTLVTVCNWSTYQDTPSPRKGAKVTRQDSEQVTVKVTSRVYNGRARDSKKLVLKQERWQHLASSLHPSTVTGIERLAGLWDSANGTDFTLTRKKLTAIIDILEREDSEEVLEVARQHITEAATPMYLIPVLDDSENYNQFAGGSRG